MYSFFSPYSRQLPFGIVPFYIFLILRQEVLLSVKSQIDSYKNVSIKAVLLIKSFSMINDKLLAPKLFRISISVDYKITKFNRHKNKINIVKDFHVNWNEIKINTYHRVDSKNFTFCSFSNFAFTSWASNIQCSFSWNVKQSLYITETIK